MKAERQYVMYEGSPVPPEDRFAELMELEKMEKENSTAFREELSRREAIERGASFAIKTAIEQFRKSLERQGASRGDWCCGSGQT